MNIELKNLPDDAVPLMNIILTLMQENNQLQQNYNRYKIRCDFLEEELRLIKDRMSDKTSEKITEEGLLQHRLLMR